jgi:hypothetical protein
MKKTTTRSDGSVETIEGTPEEFAELEKLKASKTSYDHQPYCQMTIAARGWHSVVAPRCTCWRSTEFLDRLID